MSFLIFPNLEPCGPKLLMLISPGGYVKGFLRALFLNHFCFPYKFILWICLLNDTILHVIITSLRSAL